MLNKFARLSLPALIDEVRDGLEYLVWVGGNSDVQDAWLDDIRFNLDKLKVLEIGLDRALNELCYDIDKLATLYWDNDPRATQCRAIIDEIQDFQIGMSRAL